MKRTIAMSVVALAAVFLLAAPAGGEPIDYGPPPGPMLITGADGDPPCSVGVDPPGFVHVTFEVTVDGGTPVELEPVVYGSGPGGIAWASIEALVPAGPHDVSARARWNIGSGWSQTGSATVECQALPPTESPADPASLVPPADPASLVPPADPASLVPPAASPPLVVRGTGTAPAASAVEATPAYTG